jgi:hypothetical protein
MSRDTQEGRDQKVSGELWFGEGGLIQTGLPDSFFAKSVIG